MEKRPRALLAQEINLSSPDYGKDHAHAANEFLFILSGTGVHHLALGVFPFDAGGLFFFPRGQLHAHTLASRSGRALTIRFRDEALLSESEVDEQARARLRFLKRLSYTGHPAFHLATQTQHRLRQLFRQAVKEDSTRQSGYRCMLKGLALEALVLIARDPAVGFQVDHEPVHQSVVEVLALLDANPTIPVTVEAMARHACMSRSHFHAAFKRVTGTTLIEHVTRLRLGLAARQLALTTTPILDIADQCGFGSLNRFYVAWRKHYALPPAVYRKRAQKPRSSQHHQECDLHPKSRGRRHDDSRRGDTDELRP